MDLINAKLGRLSTHGIYVHILHEMALVYVGNGNTVLAEVALCGGTTHNDEAEQVQSWAYTDSPAAARLGLCSVCARVAQRGIAGREW